MSVIKSFFISFSIYSKIPMPQFEWKKEDMRYTLIFFPWVGTAIGALLYGWMRLCIYLGLNSWCMYLIGTAIPLIVTGGFHVDGYMDTMDAFHSYKPKEAKLEILKDSHIGAFAVIMLALYYMIYIGAYSQIQTTEAYIIFCMGFYLSRILSGIGVVSLKAAKTEGMLFEFASTAHERVVKISLYVQLLVCFILMAMVSMVVGVMAIAAACICFIYYGVKSKKELGGITGDTAGYFVTICECAVAIAAAVGSLI